MSIINQYTTNEEWQKINADNVSLLRLFQGGFAPRCSNAFEKQLVNLEI